MTTEEPTVLEPGWQRLLDRSRRSLERSGGSLDARITLVAPTDAERRVVIGLTGRHRSAAAGSLSISLAELDTGLRRTRGESLPELLVRTGPPLRDRPAERAAESAERATTLGALHSQAHHDEPWFVAWRESLAVDGTLTRMVRRGEAQLATQAVAVLDRLPAAVTPLPVLAEEVTGHPKALSGTALAHLVLRALALRAGVPVPTRAAERRALWDGAGVVVDDLASQVLVLNLPATGEGLGAWLTDAAHRGIPLRVTLQQLTALPIGASAARVFVCENPAVLRAAAAQLGPRSAPLVCTEGVPATACWQLLAAIGESPVLWRNDFDWAGLRITAAALDRVAARPWRMAEADYSTALAAGDSEPLRGAPAASPWDPALAAAVAAAGRSVMEERLLPHLLGDLAEG